MKTPQCTVIFQADVVSLTGFATTTFASGSDQLPLVSDCLGNGDQRMVLNRDTFCDCTAPILLGLSLIICLCVDSQLQPQGLT